MRVPAVFLGFLKNPECAALLPSGIDVSGAGGVWLRTRKYGSWPPQAHIGVKAWATANALSSLSPQIGWDDMVVLYGRKLADEYRRWGELRRKRREIEDDYQRWLQRKQRDE